MHFKFACETFMLSTCWTKIDRNPPQDGHYYRKCRNTGSLKTFLFHLIYHKFLEANSVKISNLRYTLEIDGPIYYSLGHAAFYTPEVLFLKNYKT